MPVSGLGREGGPARSDGRSFFPCDAMAGKEAVQRRLRHRKVDAGQRRPQLVQRDVLLRLPQRPAFITRNP